MACGLRRCRGKRGCICPRASTSKASVIFSASCTDEALAVPSDVIMLFKRFDTDSNGQLDRRELGQVLQKLDSKYWTAKRIREIFRAADQNHDQLIDWNEFLNWIFADGAEQRGMREVVGPALESLEASKQSVKSEHTRLLLAAESAASLAAALKNAKPVFQDGELQKFEEQLQEKCTADVGNADTVASLKAALDFAGPFLGVEEKERQAQRLKMMQSPFKVCVSTISGDGCEVEVTRNQTVSSLCQEVATHFNKKKYSIKLAHSEGSLEPHTALLEDCGVTSSSVMLFATFGEADPLQMQLTLAEYLDKAVRYGLLLPDEVEMLQCPAGSQREIECREKFKRDFLKIEADEVSRRASFDDFSMDLLRVEASKWNVCVSGDDTRDMLIERLIAIHRSMEIINMLHACREQYAHASRCKTSLAERYKHAKREYMLKKIELKYTGSHPAELKDVIEEKLREKESSLLQRMTDLEPVAAEMASASEVEAEALEMARIALDQLGKADINAILRMDDPVPSEVLRVCLCVLVLRPTENCDESKGLEGIEAMLRDPGFKKGLQEYPDGRPFHKQRLRVRGLLNPKTEAFDGDGLKHVSRGAYLLLQWVLAVCKRYDGKGEMSRLRELQGKLRDAEHELHLLKEELQFFRE